MSPPIRDEISAKLHKSVREIYRDDVLWILDKPAGVVSHPNPPATSSSSALLRGRYDPDGELYVIEGTPRRPVFLVHRLDQDTSGLIICTFAPEASAMLKQDLYDRELEKEYRALLLDAPKPPVGVWSDRLVRDSRGGRVEVRRKASGEPNAETSYELERTFPGTGLAWVRLRPHTGKTHQLRVQAASRGVPIIGDERYGDFTVNRFLRDKIGARHMFLHAIRLTLRHPTKGKRMTFTADLSQRLTLPLERLEKLFTRVPRREPQEDEGRQRRGGGAKRPSGGARGRGGRGRGRR